jgi:hypothetical protein
MVAQGATKAEEMSTVAMDSGHDPHQIPVLYPAIHSIHAVWGGTPSEELLIVDVRSGEQFLISMRFISDRR